MEDFVPFELTVKLKEKGFREKCLAYYDVEDYVGLLYNTQYSEDLCPCQYTDLLVSYNSGDIVSNLDDSGNCIDAPTISQVLKWLREEKKIYCLPHFEQGIDMWLFCVERPQAGCEFAEYISESIYDTYEQAAIAGIEYTINNLI